MSWFPNHHSIATGFYPEVDGVIVGGPEKERKITHICCVYKIVCWILSKNSSNFMQVNALLLQIYGKEIEQRSNVSSWILYLVRELWNPNSIVLPGVYKGKCKGITSSFLVVKPLYFPTYHLLLRKKLVAIQSNLKILENSSARVNSRPCPLIYYELWCNWKRWFCRKRNILESSSMFQFH